MDVHNFADQRTDRAQPPGTCSPSGLTESKIIGGQLLVRMVEDGKSGARKVSWFSVSGGPDFLGEAKAMIRAQGIDTLRQQSSILKPEGDIFFFPANEASSGRWEETLPSIGESYPGLRQFILKRCEGDEDVLVAEATLLWDSKGEKASFKKGEAQGQPNRHADARKFPLTFDQLNTFLEKYITRGLRVAAASICTGSSPCATLALSSVLLSRSALGNGLPAVVPKLRFLEEHVVGRVILTTSRSIVYLVRQPVSQRTDRVDLKLVIAHDESTLADRVFVTKRLPPAKAEGLIYFFEQQKEDIGSTNPSRRQNSLNNLFNGFSGTKHVDQPQVSQHPVARLVTHAIRSCSYRSKVVVVGPNDLQPFYKSNHHLAILAGETAVGVSFPDSVESPIGIAGVVFKYSQISRELCIRLIPTLRDKLGNAFVEVTLKGQVAATFPEALKAKIQDFVAICAGNKKQAVHPPFPEDPNQFVANIFGETKNVFFSQIHSCTARDMLAYRNLRWVYKAFAQATSELTLKPSHFDVGKIPYWTVAGGASGYTFSGQLKPKLGGYFLTIRASENKISIEQEEAGLEVARLPLGANFDVSVNARYPDIVSWCRTYLASLKDLVS